MDRLLAKARGDAYAFFLPRILRMTNAIEFAVATERELVLPCGRGARSRVGG